MVRTAISCCQENPILTAALKVARSLTDAGYPSGIVGGAVRDLLIGKPPHDADVVTVARPEELKPIFPESELVGASFGVSLVKMDGFAIEVAAAREERNYLDGRHPELVRYSDSLEKDMLRRDFTCNALWLDPMTMEVCDTVGGVTDIQRGVLRTVGEPECRFNEDYLRMLRAVRFACSCRFEPEQKLLEAVRKLAPKCAELTGERVREELTRMFTGPEPARALELLRVSGLLAVLLPEVAALQGVTQPPEYHPEGDVYDHTMLLMRHLAAADRRVAWSALLHDIGKPAARSVESSGRIRFFNHETIGAELAEKVLERLRFSTADSESITSAIRNHMRFASVVQMRESKIRKLLADPNFATELELHRLDCIACHGLMDGFVFLLKKLDEYAGETALPSPLLSGRDLISAGLKPGPQFKLLLDEVFEEQLSGALRTKAEALNYLRKKSVIPGKGENV